VLWRPLFFRSGLCFFRVHCDFTEMHYLETRRMANGVPGREVSVEHGHVIVRWRTSRFSSWQAFPDLHDCWTGAQSLLDF